MAQYIDGSYAIQVVVVVVVEAKCINKLGHSAYVKLPRAHAMDYKGKRQHGEEKKNTTHQTTTTATVVATDESTFSTR